MQSRADYILSKISGKILDVGCSACTLHERVRDKFPAKSVYGMDIEIKKESAHYKKASAEYIPFEDAFFDSLVAGELIEHLENPEQFVKEASRVLRKGGVMVLTTPNRDSLINRLFGSYKTEIHLSLFNRDELIGLLTRNKFEIEEFTVLPYTEESSEGSKKRWAFTFRKLLHHFLPDALRENMVVLARKA